MKTRDLLENINFDLFYRCRVERKREIFLAQIIQPIRVEARIYIIFIATINFHACDLPYESLNIAKNSLVLIGILVKLDLTYLKA